jgi:hypothetical protein
VSRWYILTTNIEHKDSVFRYSFSCSPFYYDIQQLWLNNEEFDFGCTDVMPHLRNTVSRVGSGKYAASSHAAEKYHWIHDVVE